LIGDIYQTFETGVARAKRAGQSVVEAESSHRISHHLWPY